MPVTFFNSGLVVSDEAAARADAYCESVTLERYRSANNGDLPPGWPSMQARKILIEWSIKDTFARDVKRHERQMRIAAIGDDPPWEGAGR